MWPGSALVGDGDRAWPVRQQRLGDRAELHTGQAATATMPHYQQLRVLGRADQRGPAPADR